MTAFRHASILTFAFGTALITGPAFSQSGGAVEVSNNTQIAAWNMSADAVEDMNVMGANGQKVGEVEEVIGTDEATPTALVVDFDDDAGYGDRDNVMVPLASFTPGTNMLTLTSDAAAIGAMGTWDD